ncbi:lipopolysaccharide kinase InaA family protein [Anaerosinus massiliensis]|uniref:lipopolysaccharide kinase InaA family protein n=1 Tax=Massilibacillus massiliensis TaxID=1806837 RepID=UPI000DA61A93|nr:lipopolysaccharide kinase InaA family protein [Massilibacillus massiliensis]
MLQQQKYNAEINMYYQNDLYYELAEELIQFLWLKQPSSKATREIDLIRDFRSKVYKMNFKNEIYYVKSYTPQTISKKIKNYFRPADAVRYFQTSIRIKQAGVAVAQPVIALTRKRGIYPSDSIFVTREIPGIDLYTFLMGEARANPVLRNNVISQLALILAKLSTHSLAHQDTSLYNFIVHPEQCNKILHIQLIDVDNIYFRPLLPQKLILLKNLKKLKKTTQNFAVTASEYNFFLEEIRRNMNLSV